MVTLFTFTFQKIVKNLKTNLRSVKKSEYHDSNKPRAVQNKVEHQTHIITRLDNDDYEKCLNLMWNTYFKDEHISEGLGVTRNDFIDEHIHKTLSLGHSLVAKRSQNGEIVGACINDIACSWGAEELDLLACSTKNKPVRDLLKFWAFIQRAPNLDYTPHVFELSHLFVSREEQGNGIGLNLAKSSMESGADCGFPLIRLDATVHQSCVIAEKLGMKLIYEIPYCHYLAHNGKALVKPKGKNKSVKIYVIRSWEVGGKE